MPAGKQCVGTTRGMGSRVNQTIYLCWYCDAEWPFQHQICPHLIKYTLSWRRSSTNHLSSSSSHVSSALPSSKERTSLGRVMREPHRPFHSKILNVVFDEGHCILRWGDTFHAEYSLTERLQCLWYDWTPQFAKLMHFLHWNPIHSALCKFCKLWCKEFCKNTHGESNSSCQQWQPIYNELMFACTIHIQGFRRKEDKEIGL